MKMLQNCVYLRAADDGSQRGSIRLLHRLQAAEMLQQPARSPLADTGNFQQFGAAVPHLPPLAMKGDRKAVRLIAD